MTSPVVAADVYVGEELAGHFTTHADGRTEFDYVEGATKAVASTLPISGAPYVTSAGALPPFFANLLPEGRRLSTLKRTVKASLDDELSLLLAVGTDTVGDVSIVPHGQPLTHASAAIDLSGPLDFSAAITDAGIADPIAVPGVQDKASARTIAAPVRGHGTDYILKISPPEYPKLVENEAECFAIAAAAKYPLAETQLLIDDSSRPGLLITRFDRSNGTRLHVEDAAQIMGLYPSAKYTPAMEEVAEAMKAVSSSPSLTARSIAFQVALAWLTGNGDLHAKNMSLIWGDHGAAMSPIYDIPSTIPYGDSTMALSVQGRKDNISGKIFRAFCAEIGLTERAAERVMAQALRVTDGAAERIVAATDFDPRRARDLTRVLDRRRKLWS